MQYGALQKLRKACKSSDVRALGLLVVSVTICSLLHGAAAFADNRRSKPVLIYYGNETTQTAAASSNYNVLLQSLRAYGGAAGSELAGAIERDATISPSVVESETQSLLDSCGRLNADIAVFSNRLTLAGHFRFCRGASGTVETMPFAGVAPSPDAILNLTPLSRPEYLEAALDQVGVLVGGGPTDAILLTHSHGSPDMALMPRVSADVADLPPATLQHILDFGGSKPSWAALRGTSKLAFWRVLARVNSAHGMRFTLVFRQACESGPDSFSEFRAIPDSVGLVAHTAMSDLPYGKIDYRALVSAAIVAPDVTKAFAANLAAQGVHVDTAWRSLWWLAPVYLWSLPPAIWFAPVALWICWLLWKLAAPARRGRLTRASLPAAH